MKLSITSVPKIPGYTEIGGVGDNYCEFILAMGDSVDRTTIGCLRPRDLFFSTGAGHCIECVM